jgi:hypothetical protein
MACVFVREAELDDAIEAPRPCESGVEGADVVCGGDDEDIRVRAEAVHAGEQLRDRLMRRIRLIVVNRPKNIIKSK